MKRRPLNTILKNVDKHMKRKSTRMLAKWQGVFALFSEWTK